MKFKKSGFAGCIECAASLGLLAVWLISVSLPLSSWAADAAAQAPAKTAAPLLGWNSYNCYGTHIDEKLTWENLEAFIQKLKPHGYEYFVLDAGWYRHFDLKPGETWPTDGDKAHLALDEYGRFVPSPVLFPNGFKAIMEHGRKHGIKFGLHLMRGIPRQAVELNLPIKGTPYFARDIANTDDVCNWSALCYGVDMDKPGAQEYYNSVVELLADWGVDFIKYDDIVHKPREINAAADAIARTGKRIVLSISPGDDIDPAFYETYARADMIRISRDIWDLREDIEISFNQWDKLLPYADKGFWLDMDMIPFGHLRVNYQPSKNKLSSTRGYERMDYFTYAQKKSFITQRAMAASPLFMGGTLTSSDKTSFELITDPEMLACNQNGVTGSLVKRVSDYAEKVDIWKTPHKSSPHEGWIGVFNRNPYKEMIKFAKGDLGLYPGTAYALHDIWGKRAIADGDQFVFEIPADDVVFIHYKGATPIDPLPVAHDLTALHDATRVLENPHKGWYHHYPDNHINKYEIAEDSDLTEFPGMDHLYIRLAWAYLEPKEGQFDWALIDRMIEKWTGHGLGISFRISCKETSVDRIEQQYATPRWVKEAGAKGGHYRMGATVGPEGPWEPVWDDPVFLEKLERFLAAFAARYDGQPWLRYVDIGSIGDWGEGHSWAGSRMDPSFAVRKLHIDLHLKYFKRSPLVISDDFVYHVADLGERAAMHQYILANGISYRDDSIMVNGNFSHSADRFTVRSPEYFADAYLRTPTVFELDHYPKVKKLGDWDAAAGSAAAEFGKGKKGPEFFHGALELLHATYIGYHGFAREWLDDNPDLTKELLNRCGYWLFPHSIALPETVAAGGALPVKVTIENRGVAPTYHPYELRVKLSDGQATQVVSPIGRSDLSWLPGAPIMVSGQLALPANLKSGRYTVSLGLFDRSSGQEQPVEFALQIGTREPDGYYRVAAIEVAAQP